MNVVLIPFFLAANMVIDDTSKWTFGPEYTYNLNLTYIVELDEYEPVRNVHILSTLKCRPKMSDSLFCQLQNSTLSTFSKHRRNVTQELETEQMFEIKFNERGVESLLIEPPSRIEVVNAIRKITNQLSVGADLKIDMSPFITRENTSMGNCATTFRITQEEPEMDTVEEEDTNFDTNLRFVVLPMTDAKTLTIKKSRVGCINPPQHVDFSTGTLKMGSFFTKIQIGDKFTTVTELNGELRRYENRKVVSTTLPIKEILELNLDKIEPAQDELPSITYGEPIDLNINIEIPTNFID